MQNNNASGTPNSTRFLRGDLTWECITCECGSGWSVKPITKDVAFIPQTPRMFYLAWNLKLFWE